MKILFAEADELIKGIAKEKLSGHELFFEKESFDKHLASRYPSIEILSVFIGSKVTKEVIDRMPNLRMIATRSTGFDHIDVGYARKKGIVVSNVPKYGAWPVAEHVFALLLACLRKIIEANKSVKRGKWEVAGFEGKLIHGKTFGVLGTGDIGLNVCRIARGFGANVIAYDIARREKESKEIGFTYVPLDELLMKSDIISINLPLTNETRHIIDKRAIEKMKDGVVIINTGRGAVINQNDLVEALKAKKVFFAGLDVLEKEPPTKGEEILNLENVIITPHIAWDTDESRIFIVESTVENISNFIQGNPTNMIS
jgi:D-lactate dehydrogenase